MIIRLDDSSDVFGYIGYDWTSFFELVFSGLVFRATFWTYPSSL